MQFSTRQRLSLNLITVPAAFVFRILAATWRADATGPAAWRRILEDHDSVIIATNHESLLVGVSYLWGQGIHTLTSYSYDGELAARLVRHFDIWAARGSSSRGGSNALVQLERVLAEGVSVGITVDGPRGPRRAVKPGVAILSLRTGAPIVPVAFGAQRVWTLRSWDRMIVGKPFSRTSFLCGEPIEPPPDASPENVEALRQKVEQALTDLYGKLDRAGAVLPHS